MGTVLASFFFFFSFFWLFSFFFFFMTEWISSRLESIDDNFGYVHGVNHS